MFYRKDKIMIRAKFARYNIKTHKVAKEVCFSKDFKDVEELVKFLLSSQRIRLRESNMGKNEMNIFRNKYIACLIKKHKI